MLFVACSGFPIPVSRYWREFRAVEISDTKIALPGAGTVRRWIRESPEGYGFSVVAPKSVAESGFKRTKENKELCKEVAELAARLDARAVVFAADERFKHTKANRSALKSFLNNVLPADMPQVVLDLPGWKTEHVLAIDAKRPPLPAYDPFSDEPPKAGEVAYIRLPGPAGHRSRYDEAAIDDLASHLRDMRERTELVYCVFCNIDMQANAHQLMKKLS